MSELWPWSDSYVYGLQAEIAGLRALIRTIGETHMYDNHKGEPMFGSDLVILLDSYAQAALLASITKADA